VIEAVLAGEAQETHEEARSGYPIAQSTTFMLPGTNKGTMTDYLSYSSSSKGHPINGITYDYW
jgi:hypothetical protein